MEKPFIAVRYSYGIDKSIFADFEQYGYEVKPPPGPHASLVDPGTQGFIDLVTANLPVEFVKDLLIDVGKMGLAYGIKMFLSLWKNANAQKSPVVSSVNRITRIRIGAKLPNQAFVKMELTGDMSEDAAKEAIKNFYGELDRSF